MADFILDAAHRQPVIRRPGPDGETIIERIPQTAANPHRAKRWALMLDEAGNDLRVVLTTAAAEVLPKGNYRDAKWSRMLRDGWFPYGRCPMSLVATGELRDRWLSSSTREINGGRACDPKSCNDFDPCPHALNEKKVRQERHGRAEAERQKVWQTAEEKLIKANQEQTQATMEGLRELADAIRGQGTERPSGGKAK